MAKDFSLGCLLFTNSGVNPATCPMDSSGCFYLHMCICDVVLRDKGNSALEGNIEMNQGKVDYEDLKWVDLAQVSVQLWLWY